MKQIKKLYKYTTVKTAKEILLYSNIRFRNPSLFNDPYDSEPPIEFSDCDNEKFKRLFKDNETDFKDLAPEQIENLKILTQETYKSTLADLANNLRVLCLSRTKNNILMWSHYADNHEGIVIEFDASQLIIRKNKKVDYDNKPVILDLEKLKKLNDETFELTMSVFLRKAKLWQYEKEYRLYFFVEDMLNIINKQIIQKPHEAYIWNSCKNELENKNDYIDFPISDKSIRAVYFGCKTSSENSTDIINIIKKSYPHVKCYKAIKHDASFRLTFEEIKL